MARRTAQDFVEEVRDLAGGETSETLSDTRILRYVNQALTAFEAKYLFPELKTTEDITTSSGTAEYTMSNVCLQIDDVVDTTNYYHLRPISEYQYQEYIQGNASATLGTPVYYFISGSSTGGARKITFFPTPAGTYTLTVGYWAHTDLVLTPAATSPVIPIAFDDAVILRAASRALYQARDYDGAYKLQLASNDSANFAAPTAKKPSYKPIRPISVISGDLR